MLLWFKKKVRQYTNKINGQGESIKTVRRRGYELFLLFLYYGIIFPVSIYRGRKTSVSASGWISHDISTKDRKTFIACNPLYAGSPYKSMHEGIVNIGKNNSRSMAYLMYKSVMMLAPLYPKDSANIVRTDVYIMF